MNARSMVIWVALLICSCTNSDDSYTNTAFRDFGEVVVIGLSTEADVGTFSGGLAVFREGTQVGYINKEGAVQIAPRFDTERYRILRFMEGLAVAKLGDSFGFVDENGDFVIEPSYEEAHPFFNGMARVKVGERYGFIDRETLLLHSQTYSDANDFSEGLAAVEDDEGWHFVNPQLEVQVPGPYRHVNSFSDGVAWVTESNETRPFFVDREGHVVIEDWPGFRTDFHEGFNLTRVGAGERTRQVRFLSYRGQTKEYHPGAEVYLDKNGDLAFLNVFDQPSPRTMAIGSYGDFHEGLARQIVSGSLWRKLFDRNYVVDRFGYIDDTGEFVINAQYTSAEDFSGGFALVGSDSRRYFINKIGQRVTAETFARARSFSEGAAAVQRDDGKWYLLLDLGKSESL